MENHQGIVILCSPSLVNWMHKTFAELFADQHLPASIVWSGHSCRYGQGVVMVAWTGEVSEHFLLQYPQRMIPHGKGEAPETQITPHVSHCNRWVKVSDHRYRPA